MLATLNDVLKYTDDCAIPAFNIFGYEDAKACIDAAEELDAPVILATNQVALNHISLPVFASMLTAMAKETFVPVVIHLDHAQSYEKIAQAIKLGYSSVMYDGSHLPLENNISNTKEIVKMAHSFGVSVEAELGSVAYRDKFEHVKTVYTDPVQTRIFSEETNVDALAVSVGSLHRMEKQEAKIQWDLIKEIESQTAIPLVMHGASGIKNYDIERLINTNFSKMNFGTVLRIAFGSTLRSQFEGNKKVYDRMDMFPSAMEAVKKEAIQKMIMMKTKNAINNIK